jgi:hypothetical protein
MCGIAASLIVVTCVHEAEDGSCALGHFLARSFQQCQGHPLPMRHRTRELADDAATVAIMTPLTSGELSMNIFVGNLAFTTTEHDLRQLFEPYGTVDAIRIMLDRDTGRSRGFGFVEMPDRHAAQDAIAGLNGTSLAGRTLTINEARPREPREPRW